MPIGLNVNCKKRLIEVIAEGLPNVRVSHGMFLNDTRILGFYQGEGVIPKNGEIRDKLVSYIDDFPVISFCSDNIARAIYERGEYLNDDQDANLTEMEGYKDPKSVAEFLVADLDSLPWKYTLTMELPLSIGEILHKSVGNFQLADGISLIIPNAEFSSSFPLSSGDEKRNKRIWRSGYNLLMIHAEPKWMDSQAYFQISIDGYIDMYGGTNPANRAVALLKAFCGLGMALRAFDYKYSYFPMPIKRSYYTHRLIDGNWEIDGKFNIPEHDMPMPLAQVDGTNGRAGCRRSVIAW